MTQQPNSLTELKPRFVVDTPPFMHTGYTIHSMMRDMFIALFPAMTMAVFVYGLPALRVLALASGTAVLVEALWQWLLGQQVNIHDGTAFISGLLFGCLLPAGAPWWLVITGSAFMIVLGKQVFGGLGCNPLCPPLVGWAVMTVAWPMYLDPTAMNLHSTFVDPLLRMKYFGYTALPEGVEVSLLLGQQLGGLGSSQIAAVILGGLYLIVRKAIRWEISLAFLLGVLIVSGIFWQFAEAFSINPVIAAPPHLYLLTGSTVFAAFFLATDHASSPFALAGMLVYGLLAGFMVVVIRLFGVYPDGAPFAVLVAALLTPICDLMRPMPYGKRR